MTAAPSRRPLPAYAGELARARARGMVPRDRTVSVGLHWRKKRPSIGYGVVCPNDVDPASLDWTWTRGLEVMVWSRGDDPARVRAAVGAIRAAAPYRLMVIDVSKDGKGGRIINVVRPAQEAHAACA